MNWTQYTKEVKRTAAANPGPMGLAVFALGLVGEAGEVITATRATRAKELGDVAWYLAALAQHAGVDIEFLATALAPTVGSVEDMEQLMLVHASQVADYVKKVVGHGHELDKFKLHQRMHFVMAYWKEAVTRNNFDAVAILQQNVAKLRERYPEGFDAERSKAHAG